MTDIGKRSFEPCAICDNTGWVCEGHGNHPWRGVSNRPDSCDFGPGMPCPSSTCEHSLARRDDDNIGALRAEVERLRAALQHIADDRLSSSDEVRYLKNFARAAINGQPGGEKHE